MAFVNFRLLYECPQFMMCMRPAAYLINAFAQNCIIFCKRKLSHKYATCLKHILTRIFLKDSMSNIRF